MRDQRDQDPWRLGPRGRRWLDLSIVIGLVVLGGVGHLAADQPVAMVFTVAEVLPLLWRRRHAWPVFLVVAGASALQAVAWHEPIVGQLAFPVAVYAVARWSPRWQGVVALLVGYAAAVVASGRWPLGFGGELTAGNLVPYAVTIARSSPPRGRSAGRPSPARGTSPRWSPAPSRPSGWPSARWSWPPATSVRGSPARCTTSSPTGCR